MAIFRMSGQIIDNKNSHQVSGLRVEAWDKDLIYNDLLGSTVTDGEGKFKIQCDESDFQDVFLDREPDIFFKVFRDSKLIAGTEDSVLWNVKNQDTQIMINITQLSPGFNLAEAKAMLGICAELNGQLQPTPPNTVPPLPPVPLPKNWQRLYKSGESILDNVWELWKNTEVTGQYALAFRGTVTTKPSIVEDLLAVMIPAKGSVDLKIGDFSYQLAADSRAGVHVGFTLGLATLILDVIDKINDYAAKGATQFFITGHSQGAALATLCRSLLQYTKRVTAKDLVYKTYVFAQPKPGNDYYGYDFDAIASNQGMAFRITNNRDWVPQVPFTIQLLKDPSAPNPVTELKEKLANLTDDFEELKQLKDKIEQKLEQKPGHHLKGKILPTLNYVGCGIPIVLQGIEGDNPQNPNDFFWQHHAAIYYQLLCQTFPES